MTPSINNAVRVAQGERQRQNKLQKREKEPQSLKFTMCKHKYAKPSYCLQCSPWNACACGSKRHKRFCCETKWNEFGRKSKQQNSPASATSTEPAEVAKPAKFFEPAESAEPQPAVEPEHAAPTQKMRKVVIGNTELQVENGATLTIAGISVTIG